MMIAGETKSTYEISPRVHFNRAIFRPLFRGLFYIQGMQRARPGIAYVIDLAGALVVPVGILGTRDDFLARSMRVGRPKLELRIGKPFSLPPLEGKGEARRAARQYNADRVMLKIAGLLPEEYHGAYADEFARADSL